MNYEIKCYFIRFEVFTAVTMKNTVFWDVAPCRSCVNRRFGGMYYLHLQGKNIRELRTSLRRWLQTCRRMRIGCINPHFLDLAVAGVVNFSPLELYPQGKKPPVSLDRRLGGPQSRSGQRGEEKILDPIGTRIPNPQSFSP
jgi:hypothetical protein